MKWLRVFRLILQAFLKSIPHAPIVDNNGKNHCPVCGSFISNDTTVCKKCMQRIKF